MAADSDRYGQYGVAAGNDVPAGLRTFDAHTDRDDDHQFAASYMDDRYAGDLR